MLCRRDLLLRKLVINRLHARSIRRNHLVAQRIARSGTTRAKIREILRRRTKGFRSRSLARRRNLAQLRKLGQPAHDFARPNHTRQRTDTTRNVRHHPILIQLLLDRRGKVASIGVTFRHFLHGIHVVLGRIVIQIDVRSKGVRQTIRLAHRELRNVHQRSLGGGNHVQPALLQLLAHRRVACRVHDLLLNVRSVRIGRNRILGLLP